MCLTFIFYY